MNVLHRSGFVIKAIVSLLASASIFALPSDPKK
jgi:hypothetical protein